MTFKINYTTDELTFIREHTKAAAFTRSLSRLEVIVAVAGRIRRGGIEEKPVASATIVATIGLDSLVKFARMV